MHVHIQARTIDAEREEGDYSTNALAPTLPPHLAAIAPPVPALGPVPWGPQGPAPLLSEEFDAFCKAMAGNAWRDDHAADARAAWKLWSELMDDCRLDEIGRKPWEFRERLSRLPKLHGKSVFKGLTAPTAITRADAIERGKFDPSKISAVLKLGAKVERLSKKTRTSMAISSSRSSTGRPSPSSATATPSPARSTRSARSSATGAGRGRTSRTRIRPSIADDRRPLARQC